MKKILSIVAVVFVALAVIGVVAGKKDSPAVPAAAPASSSGSSPAPAAVSAPAAASTVEETVQSGRFIDFGDYTIEITDVQILHNHGYKNDDVIAFWYVTTNVSREDLNPSVAWILKFEAYQDNDPNILKKLDVSSLPDTKHLDTQMATIKIGGSLENSVGYVLDDLETPVLLKTDKFSKIAYEQEFPVK